MTIEELFTVLLVLLGVIVSAGALLLRAVGFSFGKGALITTTFLLLGFWNPVGWIVLGLCIWLQIRENRDRLLAAQALTQVPSPGTTRVEVGPVTNAGGTRRPMLRSGDQDRRR